MADWHLAELEAELTRRGWRIVTVSEGNDYDVSAVWELYCGGVDQTLFVEFEGLDDMRTLPLEECYGCRVRGAEGEGLYFSKKGVSGSGRRESWKRELEQFVSSLGSVPIS